MAYELRHHVLKLQGRNRVIDAAVHFAGGCAQLADGLGAQAILGFHRADDFLDALFRFEGEGHVLAGHALDGILGLLHRALHALHQAADLLRKLRGARGQVAHFVGHDRKAAPRLTGARRLDGGIQGQQIGLLGDRADFGQYAAHVARALRDAVGELDQFHAQPAVVYDALDDALHDVGGIAHELVETHARGIVIGARGDGNGELALLVGLLMHALETLRQLVDGIAEQGLHAPDFVADRTVLAGEFPRALGQQAVKLRHQRRLFVDAPFVGRRARWMGCGEDGGDLPAEAEQHEGGDGNGSGLAQRRKYVESPAHQDCPCRPDPE